MCIRDRHSCDPWLRACAKPYLASASKWLGLHACPGMPRARSVHEQPGVLAHSDHLHQDACHSKQTLRDSADPAPIYIGSLSLCC
eukprot:2888491-Alexandrium_andersonii.AAC.1